MEISLPGFRQSFELLPEPIEGLPEAAWAAFGEVTGRTRTRMERLLQLVRNDVYDGRPSFLDHYPPRGSTLSLWVEEDQLPGLLALGLRAEQIIGPVKIGPLTEEWS